MDTKDRLEAASLMSVYDTAINDLTTAARQAQRALPTPAKQRVNGRVTAISAADDDLRGALASVQTATAVLKRELERSLQSRPAGPAGPDRPDRPAGPAGPEGSASLDSYKYVGFEDRFRGSQEAIRARLVDYVPLFKGRSDVLDVGCGRGELLDLFKKSGISARGLDVNHEMVEACRARGLDAVEGDLVGYLESLPDGSLGGLIAVQVVEHLEPSYLMRALDIAFHKLRPGLADRPRDDQPGVLVRVLLELHPRPHARPADSPGDARVPADARADSAAPGSITGRPIPTRTSSSRSRRRDGDTPRRRRLRRDVQLQRASG